MKHNSKGLPFCICTFFIKQKIFNSSCLCFSYGSLSREFWIPLSREFSIPLSREFSIPLALVFHIELLTMKILIPLESVFHIDLLFTTTICLVSRVSMWFETNLFFFYDCFFFQKILIVPFLFEFNVDLFQVNEFGSIYVEFDDNYGHCRDIVDLQIFF